MHIADFALERYFARWEFRAPYLLCASDVEGLPMAQLLALADEELRARWEGLTLGYTESAGHPLLRQAIAGLYESVSPDDVLVFCGAQEAIFACLNVMLASGDHAVVTWPGYQSLHEVARAAGAEVTLLPLRADQGWALDLDAVRAALRPQTRLLVINYPHNPTGALLSPQPFADLLALCEEAGVWVLSDEVYRFLEYQPADRLAAAVDRSPRALSLGVMSKAFGLAGLRVGWLVCKDPGLRERCAAFKDYLSICPSAPAELLALIALRARETLLMRSQEILRSNLAHLDRFFTRWADVFTWTRPRAGSVGFPALLPEVDVDAFCQDLVSEQGVLLLPGSVYQYPGRRFRLGLGRTNLPQALERLEAFAQARWPRAPAG